MTAWKIEQEEAVLIFAYGTAPELEIFGSLLSRCPNKHEKGVEGTVLSSAVPNPQLHSDIQTRYGLLIESVLFTRFRYSQTLLIRSILK